MRPSVVQLLTWQPADLAAEATTLTTRAGALDDVARGVSGAGSSLSGTWSGPAATAAAAHVQGRRGEVEALARTVRSAAGALDVAAGALARARADLEAALTAAAAAGCAVREDGVVTPPPQPSAPTGLQGEALASWQREQQTEGAAEAAAAAGLARRISAALDAAGRADDAAQAALAGLAAPAVAPGPQERTAAPAQRPPVEPPHPGFWGKLGHGALDMAGLVPVVGEPADGLNAVWYEAQGDHLNAGLSAAGMVPLLGWGATGAKVGIKGAKALEAAKAAETAEDLAQTARATERAAEAARAADEPARRFVTTPRGTSFDVPGDWVTREARNGKGIVVQRPGAVGDADSIRIMEPTERYPNGYFRFYNGEGGGQPLTVEGLPGPKSETHIPEDFLGLLKGWPR